MANIATVLKEEIARVARKELRSETLKLKKASIQYRSEIASLKRRVVELERHVKSLARGAAATTIKKVAVPTDRMRITAKGISTLRQRLGFSAADLGFMVGVTAQSIYNWESGTSHPKEQQVAAMTTLRGMKKRDVIALLEQLQAKR